MLKPLLEEFQLVKLYAMMLSLLEGDVLLQYLQIYSVLQYRSWGEYLHQA